MREGGSGSGGGKGMLRKERRHRRIEGKRGGRKQSEEEGATERWRGEREGRGRKADGREGNIKEGTLRRTLASIQYTAESTQNNTQRGPSHCDFGMTGI